MELLKLEKITNTIKGSIQITGSKSESNRLLLLKHLYPNLSIDNVSNSDDSIVMEKALNSTASEINIGHAGTAMRFLTAYYSIKPNSEVVLTGSARMKDRPVKILVDALRNLGASIEYVEKDGYPPLKIKGSKLTGTHVKIDGNISSQYISALLMIAPTLENGLRIEFNGEVTSVPYIKMTLHLLSEIGVAYSWEGQVIHVLNKPDVEKKGLTVESDWSSASYYFSYVALSKGSEVKLSSYKQQSLQGDSVLVDIYKHLGVETEFEDHSIILKHSGNIHKAALIDLNLINAPDIAQTIAVTCFGLGIPCHLTGLHTLKIKETDRLVALKTEIEKLGGKVHITNDTLTLEASTSINSDIHIATYHDHRMAMAFAPLALRTDILFEDPDVVSKSYPDFWTDLEKISK